MSGDQQQTFTLTLSTDTQTRHTIEQVLSESEVEMGSWRWADSGLSEHTDDTETLASKTNTFPELQLVAGIRKQDLEGRVSAHVKLQRVAQRGP